MNILSNKILFFKECYQADNKNAVISNIYNDKIENRIFLSHEYLINKVESEKEINFANASTIHKKAYVYIMTNKGNTVLYTGVTSGLIKRVYEHKNKLIGGFTKKYKVNKLVYYEIFDDITNAILREKQIKAGSRKKKIELIESMNSKWLDLYETIL